MSQLTELPTTLDITQLIEKAEELVYNGRINMAAWGSVVVQKIVIDDKVFEISVVMKLKS